MSRFLIASVLSAQTKPGRVRSEAVRRPPTDARVAISYAILGVSLLLFAVAALSACAL